MNIKYNIEDQNKNQTTNKNNNIPIPSLTFPKKKFNKNKYKIGSVDINEIEPNYYNKPFSNINSSDYYVLICNKNYSLDKDYYKNLFNKIFIKDYIDNNIYKSYLNQRKENHSNKETNISKSSILNFKPIDVVLGQGRFGKAELYADKNSNNNLYVFKIIKKSKFKEQKHFDLLINEIKILKRLEHPFIVNIYNCFHDNSKVYLQFEFIDSGDLMSFIKKNNVLTIKQIKFILCQIALIIDYLHSYNIIYRDLKPENILITSSGYIKLADFGLSKYCSNNSMSLAKDSNFLNYNQNYYEGSHTFCGTPEFISPEILRGEEYGKCVDMWSLGILMYEIYYGKSPFIDTNISLLYKKIIFNEVDFNVKDNKKLKCMPCNKAIDLIQKLLVKNKYQRITIDEVLKHDYFEDINYTKILNLNILSPIKDFCLEKKAYYENIVFNKINNINNNINNNLMLISECKNKKDHNEYVITSPINKDISFERLNHYDLL